MSEGVSPRRRRKSLYGRWREKGLVAALAGEIEGEGEPGSAAGEESGAGFGGKETRGSVGEGGKRETAGGGGRSASCT